jgi:hypothetical protein
MKISVLSPERKPKESRAEVVSFRPTESPPAVPDRAVVGEVIYGDGTPIRRYYSNAIVAVGGVPVRGATGNPRRVGRDYVVDQADGSQLIYHGAAEYRQAIREGFAS